MTRETNARDAQAEAVERMSEVVANSGGDPERPRTRRQLLTLAGTAIAGGAALTILDASPAGAADDDPVLIGNFNEGTSETVLESSVSGFATLFVTNTGGSPDLKLDGTGRLAQNPALTGNAQPGHQIFTNGAFDAPAHEIVRSDTGAIWASTGSSTGSGTLWKRVNAVRVDNPNGNGSAFAPFRFYDSRNTAKLDSNTLYHQDVTAHANIPDDAVAIFGNLTATAPNYAGFLRLFPRGATEPPTSSVNFVANQTIANFFFLGLGTGGSAGEISLRTSGPAGKQVHAIIDITAYVQ